MVTEKFHTSELQQINLLTIQEVADWAKVSTKTIYRWIAENTKKTKTHEMDVLEALEDETLESHSINTMARMDR